MKCYITNALTRLLIISNHINYLNLFMTEFILAMMQFNNNFIIIDYEKKFIPEDLICRLYLIFRSILSIFLKILFDQRTFRDVSFFYVINFLYNVVFMYKFKTSTFRISFFI